MYIPGMLCRGGWDDWVIWRYRVPVFIHDTNVVVVFVFLRLEARLKPSRSHAVLVLHLFTLIKHVNHRQKSSPWSPDSYIPYMLRIMCVCSSQQVFIKKLKVYKKNYE